MPTSHLYCTACGAANETQDTFCFNCGRLLRTSTTSTQYPTAGTTNSTLTGLLTPNQLLKQRYRILKKLGKGGFGAVYQAEDRQFYNRLVAIKEMSQSGLQPDALKEAVTAFEREAVMLTGLMHPNLPRIYDHFSEGGRWYLVMDFIEGETLEEHLHKAKGGYLSVEETLQLGIQLCTVFIYLHTRQPPIIFRDLKPANIMLTPDRHAYLIDFGIARLFKPGQTKDTIAFGSFGYASPEQYGRAQTTAQSDIYSLGVILHQLLTGNNPAANTPTPFDFPILSLPVQPTPSSLKTLIMQMVEKDASKRPQNMAEIQKKLQQILAEQATGQISALTSGKTPMPPTQPVRRRSVPPTQPIGGTPPFPIRLPARIIRVLAIIAAIILFLIVLAFSISPLLNNSTRSSSQPALSSSSTTPAPAPTATPFPTASQTPTQPPSQIPSPTLPPPPSPGTVLYQADSSWSGWSGSKDWHIANGMLVNDGTAEGGGPTIVAPYQATVSDYAVEANIQVVHWNACCIAQFAMVVRASSNNNGWQGYSVGDDIASFAGDQYIVQASSSPGDYGSSLGVAPFDPGSAWHTYRIEVKGNRIRLLIDGGVKLDIADNTYLSGGQVGFWSFGVQLNISRFKIIAL